MSEARKSTMPPKPTGSGHRPALPLNAQSRVITRVALTITLVGLALWIASDFLAPLAWAAILAVTIWPLYRQFTQLLGKTRSPVLAPLMSTLVVGMILLIPLAVVAHQVGSQGGAVFSWIEQTREHGIAVPARIAQLPIGAEAVQQWWTQNLSDPKSAASWLKNINSEKAAGWISALGGQMLHRAFLFFICLIALFIFLRHGSWIARRVLDTADRLVGDPGERLASKMVDAVRGTVMGTVVVAVAEGLLIGAGYVLAGVPSPALFTLLTAAFAMVPLGAWAAFSAGALALLLADGSGWAALGVFGWGALVMVVGDHFVWPALVGNQARLPFLLALIGVFGGVQVFGLIGLFIGPVIMASLMTIWREWVVGAAEDGTSRAG